MKQKEVFVNLFLVVIASLFAYLFAYQFGVLFGLIGGSRGSFLDMTYLVGLPDAYLVSIVFLFTVFGKGNKKVWLLILLIPVILIQVLDLLHVYISIIVGLVGLWLGLGVEKGIKMIKK